MNLVLLGGYFILTFMVWAIASVDKSIQALQVWSAACL